MHNFDFALEELILGFFEQLFALILILIERIAGSVLSGFLF